MPVSEQAAMQMPQFKKRTSALYRQPRKSHEYPQLLLLERSKMEEQNQQHDVNKVNNKAWNCFKTKRQLSNTTLLGKANEPSVLNHAD